MLKNHVIDRLHASCCQPRQRLAGLHEAKVDIRLDLKIPKHLIQHFAVLPRAADDRLNVSMSLGSQDQGANLIASGRVPRTIRGRIA